MPPPARRPSKIVVGVDGSSGGARTLRWAAAEALVTGAEIEAVVVESWADEIAHGFTAKNPGGVKAEERHSAERYVSDALGTTPNISLSIAVHHGGPAEVLVEASRHAELLVVGSHGHNALVNMLLGSVTEHCVRHALCPVVVVRERV